MNPGTPHGFRIGPVEWDMLYGLPDLAFRLYMVLRHAVDFHTGIAGVGLGRNLSWHALSERCHTAPGPGITGGPSPQQARRACVWLVKAGLVKMRSNEAQRHLIFFLPFAASGIFLSGKKPTVSRQGNPTDTPHREKASKADRPSMAKADTHLDSGLLTTTTQDIRGENVDKSPGGLIVAPSLRSFAQQLLNEAEHHPHAAHRAQEALDELAGATAKGAIRGGPVPYFRALLRAITAGTFVSDLGRAVATNRARSTQEPQAQAAAPEPINGEDYARIPAGLRRTLEKGARRGAVKGTA